MTVAIYKLDKDGYRMKSHTEVTRVTKIEEDGDTLTLHTYWSDNKYEEVNVINLNKYGVDIYAGRN